MREATFDRELVHDPPMAIMLPDRYSVAVIMPPTVMSPSDASPTVR